MSYDVSTMQLGADTMSCTEQHEAYKVEHARVSALATELGPVAANCHRLHGDYESATAAARPGCSRRLQPGNR